MVSLCPLTPAGQRGRRRIRWPDFWVATDRADAMDALHEAPEPPLLCFGDGA